MRIFKSLLASAALLLGQPALAAISDGTRGDPSELFVAVYDEASGKSYYKDLGRTLVQFLQNPGGTYDLSSDPAYSAFLGKSGLVFNVAGFYPLKSDNSNISQWGYLLSSSEGAGILRSNFVAIDAVRQKIQYYVLDLNTAPYDGTPASAAANLSAAFTASDAGYFAGDDWGSDLGGQVAGSTVATTDTPLDFYCVNNSTGQAEGQVLKAGSWTLSSAGVLTFASSGSLGSNQPPTANAGADQTVGLGVTVSLDGSASSDPDSAPTPLTYTWTQTSGPSVTLTNANSATPSFLAGTAGTYVFTLTVNDGAATASDTVQVTVSEFPASGPAVLLDVPSTWTVGQRQTITWRYQEIEGKRKATIKFAKNGVKFKKLIKTVPLRKGSIPWKPGKSFVTANGALQICVKPTKKSKLVCDTANIVVERKAK